MSVEAIQTPVDGSSDGNANPSVEDRISALNREAEAEFIAATQEAEPAIPEEESEGSAEGDPSDSEEAGDVEAEADADAEDLEAEAGEDSDEAKDEDQTPIGLDWDGDPDTVPAELKPGFDRQMKLLNKGVNKKLMEIAEVRKQMEAAKFQYEQAMFNMQQQAQSPSSAESGPPKPPGEGATAAEWQEFDAKNTEYYTKKVVNDLRDSGQIPDASQVAQMQQQMELQNRYMMITKLPGASDDVLMKMHDMAEADPRYLDLYGTDEGAQRFFYEAKLAVDRESLEKEKQALEAERAAKAQATAKRKAGAAKRAIPRPGGVKSTSSAVKTFNKKAFNSVEEQLAALNADIMQENGL